LSTREIDVDAGLEPDGKTRPRQIDECVDGRSRPLPRPKTRTCQCRSCCSTCPAAHTMEFSTWARQCEHTTSRYDASYTFSSCRDLFRLVPDRARARAGSRPEGAAAEGQWRRRGGCVHWLVFGKFQKIPLCFLWAMSLPSSLLVLLRFSLFKRVNPRGDDPHHRTIASHTPSYQQIIPL